MMQKVTYANSPEVSPRIYKRLCEHNCEAICLKYLLKNICSPLILLSGMIIAYIKWHNKGGDGMPIYEYQCVDCRGRDQRVAGLDDHTALCTQCGSLMLRLDEDVFQPYFEKE